MRPDPAARPVRVGDTYPNGNARLPTRTPIGVRRVPWWYGTTPVTFAVNCDRRHDVVWYGDRVNRSGCGGLRCGTLAAALGGLGTVEAEQISGADWRKIPDSMFFAARMRWHAAVAAAAGHDPTDNYVGATITASWLEALHVSDARADLVAGRGSGSSAMTNGHEAVPVHRGEWYDHVWRWGAAVADGWFVAAVSATNADGSPAEGVAVDRDGRIADVTLHAGGDHLWHVTVVDRWARLTAELADVFGPGQTGDQRLVHITARLAATTRTLVSSSWENEGGIVSFVGPTGGCDGCDGWRGPDRELPDSHWQIWPPGGRHAAAALVVTTIRRHHPDLAARDLHVDVEG